MPTLTIGNRQIEVDESFLSMTPEQQQQAVEEIAATLGASPVATGEPPASGRADVPAASSAPVPATEGPQDDRWTWDRLGRAMGATAQGLAQGITLGGSDEMEALLSTGFGLAGSPTERLKEVRARMAENSAANPINEFAGDIAGGLLGIGGAMGKGASFLGNAVKKGYGALGRGGATALDSAAYGALDAFGREDGGAWDRTKAAAIAAPISGVVGGAVGSVAAGKTIKKATQKATVPLEKFGEATKKYYQQAKEAVLKPHAVGRILQDAINNSTIQADGAGVLRRSLDAGHYDMPYTNTAKNILFDALPESIKTKGAVSSKPGVADTMTLEQMQEYVMKLSKELSNMASGPDREMLTAMSKRMVKGINKLTDADFITPNGAKAVAGLNRAIEIGKVEKKLKIGHKMARKVKKGSYDKPDRLAEVAQDVLEGNDAKKFVAPEIAMLNQMANPGKAIKVAELAARLSPRTARGALASGASVVSGIPQLAAAMTGIGETGMIISNTKAKRDLAEFLRLISTKQPRGEFLKTVPSSPVSTVLGMMAGRGVE